MSLIKVHDKVVAARVALIGVVRMYAPVPAVLSDEALYRLNSAMDDLTVAVVDAVLDEGPSDKGRADMSPGHAASPDPAAPGAAATSPFVMEPDEESLPPDPAVSPDGTATPGAAADAAMLDVYKKAADVISSPTPPPVENKPISVTPPTVDKGKKP